VEENQSAHFATERCLEKVESFSRNSVWKYAWWTDIWALFNCRDHVGLICVSPLPLRLVTSSLQLFLEPGEPYKITPIHPDGCHQPYEHTIKVLVDQGLNVARGFIIGTPKLERYAEEYVALYVAPLCLDVLICVLE